MNGSDLGACQHGDGLLRNHGQVCYNSVSLLHAHTLEGVGQPIDLSVELIVGDGPCIAHRLTNEVVGHLVSFRRVGMPVHCIVSHIDLSVGKPFVMGLLGIVKDLGVGLEPIDIGFCHLVPEFHIVGGAPLAHFILSLESLPLHPLIRIRVLNNPLWCIEDPGLFLENSRFCSFRFHSIT